MIGKISVLVWNNGKYQSTILHATRCAITETYTNKYQELPTNLCSTFVEIFYELDWIQTFQSVDTLLPRDYCNNKTHHARVTDTEESNLNKKDSMMPLIINHKNSDDNEGDPPIGQPPPLPQIPKIYLLYGSHPSYLTYK